MSGNPWHYLAEGQASVVFYFHVPKSFPECEPSEESKTGQLPHGSSCKDLSQMILKVRKAGRPHKIHVQDVFKYQQEVVSPMIGHDFIPSTQIVPIDRPNLVLLDNSKTILQHLEGVMRSKRGGNTTPFYLDHSQKYVLLMDNCCLLPSPRKALRAARMTPPTEHETKEVERRQQEKTVPSVSPPVPNISPSISPRISPSALNTPVVMAPPQPEACHTWAVEIKMKSPTPFFNTKSANNKSKETLTRQEHDLQQPSSSPQGERHNKVESLNDTVQHNTNEDIRERVVEGESKSHLPLHQRLGSCDNVNQHGWVCAFCRKQKRKLHSGRIRSLSQYCPCQFFSLKPQAVEKAIRGLLMTPQNNLKIFCDSELIYGGGNDTLIGRKRGRSLSSSSSPSNFDDSPRRPQSSNQNKRQRSVSSQSSDRHSNNDFHLSNNRNHSDHMKLLINILKSKGDLNVDSFVEFVKTSILENGNIIRRLEKIQNMVESELQKKKIDLAVDNTAQQATSVTTGSRKKHDLKSLWEHVKDKKLVHLLEPKCLLEGLHSIIGEANTSSVYSLDDFAIDILRQHLIARTVKDCSVFITFQTGVSGRVQGSGGEQRLGCSKPLFRVVDLDIKHYSKIDGHIAEYI
eukprot:g42.t1